MSAPVSPSDAREAAGVLGALLAALPPAKTARERRMRGALREAQRALREPGVRELDALADQMGSEGLRDAAATTASRRAVRAVSRYYARQP